MITRVRVPLSLEVKIKDCIFTTKKYQEKGKGECDKKNMNIFKSDITFVSMWLLWYSMYNVWYPIWADMQYLNIPLTLQKVTERTLQSMFYRMSEGLSAMCLCGQTKSNKTSVENSIAVIGVKKALLIGKWTIKTLGN